MQQRETPFSHEVIGARQGFDEYVLENREANPNIHNGQLVVDINRSGMFRPTEFSSFLEIDRKYHSLKERLPADEPDHDVIEQQLIADSILSLELQGVNVPYDEYMLATAGFIPEKVPGKEIDLLLTTLDNRFGLFGLRYDEEGVKKYHEEHLLTDPAKIKEAFKLAMPLARTALRPHSRLITPHIDIKPVNLPKVFWSGYIFSDNYGNMQVTANINPSRRYTRARILQWCLHEGEHYDHFDERAESVASRRMSPAANLTGMASPETVQLEGGAGPSEDKLPDLAQSEEERNNFELERTSAKTFTAVIHNATIDINSGVPEKQVIKEAQDLLLREEPERIRTIILQSRDLPEARAVIPTYQFSYELMAPLFKVSDPEKRKQGLDEFHKRALTIPQMRQLVAAAQS